MARGHKNGGRFAIDIYAYDSKINHWNSALKVGLAILMLLGCIIFDNLYVSALVIAISAFITVGLGKLPVITYIKLLCIPMAFLIVGSFIIAVNFGVQEQGLAGIWLPFNYYVFVTTDSLNTVLHLWGKAFGGLSAMFMMSLSTPSNEIFSVLRKIKVPALVIELMNMIYRFIFVMVDTFVRMNNSAESRLGYVDGRTALHTFGNIAGNLLVISIKKGSHYYDAMESRCYDGELIFWEDEKQITSEQAIYAGTALVLIVATWLLTK